MKNIFLFFFILNFHYAKCFHSVLQDNPNKNKLTVNAFIGLGVGGDNKKYGFSRGGSLNFNYNRLLFTSFAAFSAEKGNDAHFDKYFPLFVFSGGFLVGSKIQFHRFLFEGGVGAAYFTSSKTYLTNYHSGACPGGCPDAITEHHEGGGLAIGLGISYGTSKLIRLSAKTYACTNKEYAMFSFLFGISWGGF